MLINLQLYITVIGRKLGRYQIDPTISQLPPLNGVNQQYSQTKMEAKETAIH